MTGIYSYLYVFSRSPGKCQGQNCIFFNICNNIISLHLHAYIQTCNIVPYDYVESGGVDQKGNPLIVFPTDSADLIDVYSFGDILRLLTVYTDIAGGKVAIVADLKHGWTEECIRKLTLLLDEMQVKFH